jgi:methyltransferase (TIGR00027 family)
MARTDNDTWDLASSVGRTATMVAAQRALSNREGLIDDPFAEPLVRAVGLDFFTGRSTVRSNSRTSIPSSTCGAPQRYGGPHPLVRHVVHRCAGRGVRQAVILAAGLDARAYRLPWPDGTTVYELDQPEVIEFKSKTLADLVAQPAAERRAIAIDLRNDWPKALLENGFDPPSPPRGSPRAC